MAALPMPPHIQAAYKEAIDNIIFHKRQQWVSTNYALLVYVAIFVVSARFFSRTDLALGWLGLLVILTFAYHMIMLRLLQDMLARCTDRLAWIYKNYFTEEEQVGLNLWPEPNTKTRRP